MIHEIIMDCLHDTSVKNSNKNYALSYIDTGTCKVLYVARLVNARPDTRDFDSKRTPLFVEYRTRRLWFSGIEKHSVS